MDRADYLLALDRLRAQNPDAYATVLNWHRSQLLLCWKALSFRADYPPHFIAHAAMAQSATARTLMKIIDDYENTIDKLTVPERQEEDFMPAGLKAGS